MSKDKTKQMFDTDVQNALREYFEATMNEANQMSRKIYQELWQYNETYQCLWVSNVVKDVKKQYLESLKREVEKAYKQWVEGEASIHSVMLKEFVAKKGDNNYREAERFETITLSEILNQQFKAGLDDPNENEIKLNKTIDQFTDELAAICNKGKNQLEKLRDEVKHMVTNKSQDTSHYFKPLGILLNSIITQEIEFWDTQGNRIRKKYKGTLEDIAAKTNRDEDAERKRLKAFAEKIGDSLERDSELFGEMLF